MQYLAWIIAAICFLGWVGNSQHWRRKYAALHSTATLHTDMCTKTSNDFLESVRLISIHRKGRLNYFTFIRGTEPPFMIETMGILADDLQQWANDTGFTIEPSAPGTIMLSPQRND